MDVRTHGNAPATGTIASGLKVTMLVVVVGVVLAVADHSLVAPRDGADNVQDVPAATDDLCDGRLRGPGRSARPRRRSAGARRSVLTVGGGGHRKGQTLIVPTRGAENWA